MNDDVIAQIQGQRKQIQDWMNNPITKMLLADNKEEQEKLVRYIVSGDFADMKEYHTATGHLRGLKRAFGVVEDALDSLDNELKQLQ